MKERQLVEDINKRIKYLEESITSGSCNDYQDYRYQVGRLSSYREIIQIIKSLKDD